MPPAQLGMNCMQCTRTCVQREEERERESLTRVNYIIALAGSVFRSLAPLFVPSSSAIPSKAGAISLLESRGSTVPPLERRQKTPEDAKKPETTTAEWTVYETAF